MQLMQFEWQEVQHQVAVLQLYQSPDVSPFVKIENFDFMTVNTKAARAKLVRVLGVVCEADIYQHEHTLAGQVKSY